MRFLQLHILTAYPPANLNRDDNQRPKTVQIGGATRQRISSQALKRAWRTSNAMQGAVGETMGTRTAQLGDDLHARLVNAGVDPETATERAGEIAGAFAKLDTQSKLRTAQMPFLDAGEVAAARELADSLAAEGGRAPTKDELAALPGNRGHSFDVAAFGRMLANHPAKNVEAAVQVGHAFAVNKSVLEDDYFTAVDDWKSKAEDSGAQHVGETTFGANLFYTYVTVNRDVLLANLGGGVETARAGLDALVRSALTVGPPGMQAPFASHARAVYALAEKGDQAPRSLANAFHRPVTGQDHVTEAVNRLENALVHMDTAYEGCADERCKLVDELGTFAERRKAQPGAHVAVPSEESISGLARFAAGLAG